MPPIYIALLSNILLITLMMQKMHMKKQNWNQKNLLNIVIRIQLEIGLIKLKKLLNHNKKMKKNMNNFSQILILIKDG